ncbi:MAG: response regulator [Aggregatilineales bacterium]
MSTILIVEDDKYIGQFIAINLSTRGYDALLAETVQEGLDLLRKFAPQLLIVDIKLPDMSGWDMLNIIDSDPTLAKLPVIIMTASTLPHQANEYSYSNIVETLIKPFGAIDLLRVVGAVVT